jgi:hypothetical protein
VKRFTITGSFEAESIDDAFSRLGAHFTLLALGADQPMLETFPGPHEFTVEPEAAPATGRAEPS